jgi:arsenate reductase (thioredoxin)
MTTVLFACVHNAGRSQVAAALFNQYVDPSKARAISAGTRPADRVHPEVITAMQNCGIDLAAHTPQQLTPALCADAGWLITMGCGDECPVVPGTQRDDWPILDPKGQSAATVESIVGDIDQRVRAFVTAHGWESSSYADRRSR